VKIDADQSEKVVKNPSPRYEEKVPAGRMRRKTAVFVDGANMYFVQNKIGWQIGWKKLIKYLSREYNIVVVRYYSGLKKDDAKMQKYLNNLDQLGFSVITKPLKKISIGSAENIGRKDADRFIYKANFDVEIAVDMILMKDVYEELLLFSGDSDFEYVLKQCQQNGKRVTVCGVKRGMSTELKKIADNIIWLGDIRDEVEYTKTPARKPRIT
jgi:uncharacterized LabA/DUF88 family protein